MLDVGTENSCVWTVHQAPITDQVPFLMPSFQMQDNFMWSSEQQAFLALY